MLTLLLIIFFMIVLFKFTGWMFHLAGKLLGFIFGSIGWLILAGLAVAVFGIAIYILPIILIVGIAALIVAAAAS